MKSEKESWESLILKHMRLVDRPIKTKELFPLMEKDLIFHGVMNKDSKAGLATLRKNIQLGTFPPHKRTRYFKSTYGKGKGVYELREKYRSTSKTGAQKIPLKISQKLIEEKMINENVASEIFEYNRKKLKQATRDHEKIIQSLLAYAKEYNIKLYAQDTRADVLIQHNGNEVSLLEIKTTNPKNIRKQTRLAMAQLLDYKFQFLKCNGDKKPRVNTYIIHSDAELDDNHYEFLTQYIDGVYSISNKKGIVKTCSKNRWLLSPVILV